MAQFLYENYRPEYEYEPSKDGFESFSGYFF